MIVTREIREGMFYWDMEGNRIEFTGAVVEHKNEDDVLHYYIVTVSDEMNRTIEGREACLEMAERAVMRMVEDAQ